MYRFGRVNFILALRLELLKEVERLKARCVHVLYYLQWYFKPAHLELGNGAVGICISPIVVLQESLGVPGDVAYTCETAGHFYLYQILSRWEQYVSKVKPLSKKVSGYTGTCIYM